MSKDLQGGVYEYINIPEDEESYYPSLEEQQHVKENANSRNPFMLKMKRIWNDEHPDLEITKLNVAKFLQRLFVEDRIPCLLNGRSRIEQKNVLYVYLRPQSQSGSLYMTKEEMAVISSEAEALELSSLGDG